MSINTITPTFNNHIPNSELDRIKAVSDAKSKTEHLTFSNSGLDSSHGKARQRREAIQDNIEIAKLSTEDDWSHCEDIH